VAAGAIASKRTSRDGLAALLCAQDRLAPELIEAWAIEAELNGCSADKAADARVIAASMRGWRKRKMPD